MVVDQIEPLIRDVRGVKVMLDKDLATLYGVPTNRPLIARVCFRPSRKRKRRIPQTVAYASGSDIGTNL